MTYFIRNSANLKRVQLYWFCSWIMNNDVTHMLLIRFICLLHLPWRQPESARALMWLVAFSRAISVLWHGSSILKKSLDLKKKQQQQKNKQESSLILKYDKLCVTMEVHNPDMICIVETWLCANIPHSWCKIHTLQQMSMKGQITRTRNKKPICKC